MINRMKSVRSVREIQLERQVAEQSLVIADLERRYAECLNINNRYVTLASQAQLRIKQLEERITQLEGSIVRLPG